MERGEWAELRARQVRTAKARRTINIETLFFVIPAVAKLVNQKDLYSKTQSLGQRVLATVCANAYEDDSRTFLRFSPSRSTSPMIFSLCPLPYIVAVSQTVHPCLGLSLVRNGSDHSAGRSRTRRPSLPANAQSRSPCAKSPCSLRRSACRTRSSSLRRRSRSATLRRQRWGTRLEWDEERTHCAKAGQRELSAISESSCLWHASWRKSGS